KSAAAFAKRRRTRPGGAASSRAGSRATRVRPTRHREIRDHDRGNLCSSNRRPRLRLWRPCIQDNAYSAAKINTAPAPIADLSLGPAFPTCAPRAPMAISLPSLLKAIALPNSSYALAFEAFTYAACDQVPPVREKT